MLQVFGKFLVLAFGAFLPLACFGQSWSVGSDYALSGARVRGVARGQVSAERSSDVLVATDAALWMLTGDGKGSLQRPVRLLDGEVDAVVVGSFTGSRLDDFIVMTNAVNGVLYLYANRTGGEFAPPVPIPLPDGVSGSCILAATDLNGDGRPDLALSCQSQPGVVIVGLNDGSGRFTFAPAASVGTRQIVSIASGDFDGDKHVDLAVVSSEASGSHRGDVLWGVDGKSFVPAINALPSDATFAVAVDFVGNGHAEIVVLGASKLHTLGASGSRVINELEVSDVPVGWEPSSGVAALLQRGKDTSGVTAQDVVFSGICADLPQSRGPCVAVLTNATATDIEIGVPAKRSLGEAYTFNVLVRALHGNTINSGNIVVWAGRDARIELPLSNGQATFKVMLPRGVQTLVAGFMGGEALSWAGTKRIMVVGPSEEDSGATAPQFASKRAPLKRQQALPSRWSDGINGAGSRPHLVLVSNYAVTISKNGYSPASPVNYGTPYIFNGSARSNVDANSQNYYFACGPNFGERCYPSPGYLIPTGQPIFWVDGGSQGTVSYNYVDSPDVCGQADDGSSMYCDNWTEYFSWTGTLATGAHTVTAQWINTSAPDANSGTISWPVSVLGKATPSLSVACSANPITYGAQTTNCTSSLTGGSSPTGTISWTINGGGWTTTSINGSAGGFAGYAAGSYTIGVAYSGDGNNNTVSGSTTLTINKASRTAGVSCSPNPTTYGNAQTTCSGTVSAGAGTMVFTYNGGTAWTSVGISGGSASAVGFTGAPVATYPVKVTANGDANYNDGATATVNYVVNKATPTVSTWPTASGLTYGQMLASSTLSGGSATTAGTFAWTAPSTAPGAGTNSYSVTFTPSDTTSYNTPAAGSVSVTTAKATPTVSVWPTSSGITFGQTLGSSTLSGGTASVGGSFAWTTPGTAPGAGTSSQPVRFTPTDATDYNTVGSSVNVTVAKATPTVSKWPTASGITYGQTLASSTLSGGNATAAGTFVWAAPSTAPGAGTNSYSVTFTPTDTTDYNTPAAGTVSVITAKASVTVNVASSVNPDTYGDTVTFTFTFSGFGAIPTGMASVTIDGKTVGVISLVANGTASYTTSALNAGSRAVATIYGGDSNYF